MIKLIDINKSFRGRQVLKHINLEVRDGETLAIIGGSGMGKSTLLRLMIGLIRPTSGEIWIGGREISRMPEQELDRFVSAWGWSFNIQHCSIP